MTAVTSINAPDNRNRPFNTGDGSEFGDNPQTIINKLNAMLTGIFGGTVAAGGGTATFGLAGNLAKQLTTIGSSATNTTQTLFSFSLPPSTLGTSGNAIQVAAWGRKAKYLGCHSEKTLLTAARPSP